MASGAEKRETAPEVLGRLIGATLSGPTAAVALLIAYLSRCSLGEAVTRAVVSGLVVYFLAGFAARFFFASVGNDWRRSKRPGGGAE